MIRDALSAFTGLIFPKACHICSKDIGNKRIAFDDYICASCAKGMTCANEENSPSDSSFKRLFASFSYEGATKKLIRKFKYENRPYLAATICRLIDNSLNETSKKILSKIDGIVAVPLYPSRQREREFNQSELIAEGLSILFNKPVIAALKKNKNTRPQALLEKNARLKNILGAFSIIEPSTVEGKNILLVDDVVTTKATVNEASKTLKNEGGALSVSILAFAKG